MPALPAFRHYCICQDAAGGTIELWRGAGEVACLAFDTRRQVLVELHVATGRPERPHDSQGFQNLPQLAAPVRHRHVLGVIEGGADDGADYHVTDFLDGERLESWLERVAPLPPWLALLVLRQVVEGLTALADHPRLLAGVELRHAGLTLTGDRVDDVLVKVCVPGPAGVRPAGAGAQQVEARAIREAGRLLLEMLTGVAPREPVTAAALPENPDTEEIRILLETVFQPAAPRHPGTLEQLRVLVDRCAHQLPEELTAHPGKLPGSLRPRLPLAAYLPDGKAVAGEVAAAAGGECVVDTRPWDAAQPYLHRGVMGAARDAAEVQVLPPSGMVPPEFFAPLLDQAWGARLAGESPYLLKLHAWNAAAAGPPVIVEELPGRWTLETLVRLRQRLEPAEALLLLRQLDAAAEAAAGRGLPLHWRSPRLVPVRFIAPGAGEETAAAAGRLARLPLGEWPAFRLKVRTWPLMLNFTQPERFQLDRLMPGEPGLPVDSGAIRAGILTPPTARDFALLAVWMMGGTAQLRENVKPLLYEMLHAKTSVTESRREFLERFHQRVEASAAPPVPASSPAPFGLPGFSAVPGTGMAPADRSDPSDPSDPADPADPADPSAPADAAEPLTPAAAFLPPAVSGTGGGGAVPENGFEGGEPDAFPPAPARPVPPVRPQPAPFTAPAGRSSGNRRRRSALKRGVTPPVPVTVAVVETGMPPVAEIRVPAETVSGLFSHSALPAEEEPEAPPMGFAEALFGENSPAASPADTDLPPLTLFPAPSAATAAETEEGTHPLFERLPPDIPIPPAGFETEIPEGAPPGFMEAVGLRPSSPDGPLDPETEPPPRRSPWLMVLMVVLISAAIAAVMAELSGRAVWHR